MTLCQRLDSAQVLQLALGAMYVLVGVSAVTGWLPAGCFGALCLAFPVVRPNLSYIICVASGALHEPVRMIILQL